MLKRCLPLLLASSFAALAVADEADVKKVMEGKLGTIAPGAYADLLVVNGNPLKDLGVFQNQGRDLHAIMKNGKFHKQQLAA